MRKTHISMSQNLINPPKMWVNFIDKKSLTNREKRGIMADGIFFYKKRHLIGVIHSILSLELDRKTWQRLHCWLYLLIAELCDKRLTYCFAEEVRSYSLMVTAMTH